MKRLSLIFLTLLLSSCASSVYYQVFNAQIENGTIAEDKIIFEDKNCIASYNLWSEGGDIGFSIFNKTDNEITLDLTKTFFVLNGVAFEYYQNRTFSKSTNNGIALTTYPNYKYTNIQKVSGTTTTGYSTTYKEKEYLTIPPKTLITISEYHIATKRYTNCELLKYPTKNKIKKLSFDKSTSPFVFYNLISYSNNGVNNKMENKFYVNEITNLPSSAVVKYSYIGECGTVLPYSVKVFNETKPNKFYIQYLKR